MRPLITDGLAASRAGTDIKQSSGGNQTPKGTRDRAEFRVESFFGLIGGGVGRNLEKENSSSEKAQEVFPGSHLTHEAEAVQSRGHGAPSSWGSVQWKAPCCYRILDCAQGWLHSLTENQVDSLSLMAPGGPFPCSFQHARTPLDNTYAQPNEAGYLGPLGEFSSATID